MGSKLLARAGALVAGGLLAFAAAVPAFAQGTVEVPLKEAHKGHTAQSGTAKGAFSAKCAVDEFNGVAVPAGYDGWHFVLPAQGSPNAKFTKLTFTFDTGVVTIDETGASGGLTGWIRGDQPRHAYLFTPAGWTLLDGVATVTGGSPRDFNISHACPGKPGDEPGDEPGEEPGDEPGDEPG
ncbi:MAG TPA: hypothetical protein VKZ74_01715 [Natronosporangium sp.]|nr:hypothetical protein [Natronosporangium sp.]